MTDDADAGIRLAKRVAALAGSAQLGLLTWAIGGLIALLGALTFAELGAMVPRAGGQYELLRDAYRFLRRLEQRIHVHRGDGTNWVDAQALGLSGLGRKMGFQHSPSRSAGEQLFERYLTVTETVRATYLRLLGLSE